MRLVARPFFNSVVPEQMALSLEGALLTLGLPVCEIAAKTKEYGIGTDGLFGVSRLWWERERTLVTVPDFTFAFTLALGESNVDPDDIHNSLVYLYMRQLRLPAKSQDFQASPNADALYHLSRRRVIIADADLPKEWPVGAIETLLGRAGLDDIRALYAEKSHAYRRRVGHSGEEEADDDLDEPLHRLFELERWRSEQFIANTAFRAVFTVKCRNHVIAATVIAALLPFPAFVSSPSCPAADNKDCGVRFFLSGNCETKGYLVRAKEKRLSVVVRGVEMTRENVAVGEVARQLGRLEPLRQAFVTPVDARLPPYMGGAAALMLVPVVSATYHPVFARAGPKPYADSIVRVHVQPAPGEDRLERDRFQSTILTLHPNAFTYLGELTHDCVIEYRYGLQATRPLAQVAARPLPNHAGGIKRVSKRLRSLDDDTDGLARKNRVKLLRDTLPYLHFLKTLRRLSHVSEIVPFIIGEDDCAADFLEVLSARENFEGLAPAVVFTCRDVALKMHYHRPASAVIRRFDAFLEKHPTEDFTRAAWQEPRS